MNSEDIPEEIKMEPTADFLSAEELVSLRKPEEQSFQLNIGLKFNECLKTPAEKEAVDSALDNYKAILSQKRGARICDLMKACWDDELDAVVLTQLKGKFVQHMGQRIGDKIALSPEESLFLIENGCLEVIYGDMPLSTEQAYALLLKEDLSFEKYEVYSYLSQLGFIVMPHHKKGVKATVQNKVMNVQNKKKKRKNPSPLPENQSNKKLNFSGVFSGDTDAKHSAESDENKTVQHENEPKDLIEPTLDIEHKEHEENEASASIKSPTDMEDKKLDYNEASLLIKPTTEIEAENHTRTKESTIVSSTTENTHTFLGKINKNSAVTEHSIDENEVVSVPPNKELENSCNSSDVDIEIDDNKSNPANPPVSASIVEMDVDSQGTDVSVGVVEKSGDAVITETIGSIHYETTTQSLNSIDAEENNVSDIDERNSDVLSLSCSSLDEFESDEDVSQDNMYMDDDVTVVEVTKKETTPLAVIDLLSDEEESGNEVSGNMDSESDDDIKILEVCNGSSYKSPAETPLNLDKLKSKKIRNYKRESSDQVVQQSTPVVPFPDLFRKDLMCVARPTLNLLPFQVRPAKEVYILDRSQLTHKNKQNSTAVQPQGRVWNSYKDMQAHQRSLRQNRHFNRNQDRPWQRGPNHADGERPWHKGSRDHDKDRQWHRGPRHDEDRPWHRNRRHLDDGYRRPYHSQHLSRGLQNDPARPDRDFFQGRLNDMNRPDNQLNGSIDQKPQLNTNSPVMYGNTSDLGTCSNQERGLLPIPPSLDSMDEVFPQPPLNLPFGNPPLSMPLRSPSGMSNLTSHQFVAEVHRTAYSYATTMLSNMLGSAFNTAPFSPFNQQGVRLATHFSMAQPITLNNGGFGFGNLNNSFPTNDSFMGNRQANSDFPRNRRQHTGNPFPNIFRNLNVRSKKSWNEVKSAVEGNTMQDDESSDIEEIPINLNEFLWNVSNICPLVRPGTKYPVSEALQPLKLTQPAKLTDKTCRYDKYVSTSNNLEISFDVYPPCKHFKKSCPGIPKLRVIVTRATHPIPVYSEISWLKREYSDGADLQIAVVDNGDISFVSFNSVTLPDIVPFED